MSRRRSTSAPHQFFFFKSIKIQKLNNRKKNASLHHHFLRDAAAALFALSSRKLSLDAMSHSFYILGNTSCPNSVVCACPLTLVFRCVLSLLGRPAHCPFHSGQLCSTCVVLEEDYFLHCFPSDSLADTHRRSGGLPPGRCHYLMSPHTVI